MLIELVQIVQALLDVLKGGGTGLATVNLRLISLGRGHVTVHFLFSFVLR